MRRADDQGSGQTGVPRLLPAAYSWRKGIRDEFGVDGQPNFIGIGVIIRGRRKIDDTHVSRADVHIRMPYEGRNADNARVLLAQDNCADLAIGLAVGTHIVADDFHAPIEEKVPVFMLFMKSPAFRQAGPYRVGVDKIDRIWMPVPPRVENLRHCAAIVHVGAALVFTRAFGICRLWRSVRFDCRRVLDRCGERFF